MRTSLGHWEVNEVVSVSSCFLLTLYISTDLIQSVNALMWFNLALILPVLDMDGDIPTCHVHVLGPIFRDPLLVGSV
jgi:uncharacterized membrane protein